MKKLFTAFYCFGLLMFLTFPVFSATTTQSITDRKLKELSNRFSALESTWGRFQIGGNFELDASSTLNKSQNALPPPEFNQQLGVFLNAYVDQNLQLSLKASQQGGWGLSYPNINSPLQVDEAFLKLSYPDSLNFLGRFRFSLGPLGIISDFFAIPVEGLAIQKAFHNFHTIVVYSRALTQYKPDTNDIEFIDDYLATRIGWSNQTTILGLNLVPNGRIGEKDFSIDWSINSMNTKIAAELGWYSFETNQPEYQNYKVGWTPGFLVSYGQALTKNTFLQLKAGYFTPNFAPYYSCLGYYQNSREWFIPNSQGIELYLQNNLKNGYGLETRLMLFTQIANSQSELNYRWRGSVVKNFSPINQLQAGIDLKFFPASDAYNQLFMNWVLQF